MKWLYSVLILMSFQVRAEVSPEHVNSMIDQMVKNNVISEGEAKKAKIKLNTMSPEQWTQINEKAATIASRSPASAETVSNNTIEEVHGIDLEGKQFQQIQKDIQKFMP